jgi:hypothetical protein
MGINKKDLTMAFFSLATALVCFLLIIWDKLRTNTEAIIAAVLIILAVVFFILCGISIYLSKYKFFKWFGKFTSQLQIGRYSLFLALIALFVSLVQLGNSLTLLIGFIVLIAAYIILYFLK